MKRKRFHTRTYLLTGLFLFILGISASAGLAKKNTSPYLDEEITQFVRRIFQDKNGHLWLGTNGDGVIRFNGEYLEYFSVNEGFAGVAVRGIVADNDGNLWFGTNNGLSKYDISSANGFTNYTVENGLIHNDIWALTIDASGLIWIGTYGGACSFNGETFTPFALPETPADETRGVTGKKMVHSIMQDRKKRIWFGSSGGAFIYDTSNPEKPLINISTKDGLCHNSVNCILEDKAGDFWFATHHKGICRLSPVEGKELNEGRFMSFSTEYGIKGTEVWDLYADKDGNIWFPVEGEGIYRYNFSDGLKMKEESAFTNFYKKEGLSSGAIQCTFQDNKGTIWFGGWMGLFSYNPNGWEEQGGKKIRHHTKAGPWN